MSDKESTLGPKSDNEHPYPKSKSKKGLVGQMYGGTCMHTFLAHFYHFRWDVGNLARWKIKSGDNLPSMTCFHR